MTRQLFVFALLAAAPPAHAQASGEKTIDRREVERAALAQHPEVRAAEARARATRVAVDAEGNLPPPELMVQVWQVPFEKPWALDRAGMIMFGLTQRFPAPGSLGAREEAKRNEALAVEARTADSARAVARAAGHAYVEYAEAASRRALHANHERVERRIVELARARHAAGGSLSEAVRAEAELALAQSELAGDATRERTAKAQINVLLGRPIGEERGAPRLSEAAVPVENIEALMARAVATRSEAKAAAAETAAMRSELDAARTESKVPAFELSALYFTPTVVMPGHSYGFAAAVELPWLWGGASARARAQESKTTAAEAAQRATRLPIEVEVVSAHAKVARAADRLRVLRGSALPAGKRAVDVTAAGYEGGAVPLAMALEAQRNVVEIEMSILDTHTELDHALVDLEAAVGASVPTRPLSDSDSSEEPHHGKR